MQQSLVCVDASLIIRLVTTGEYSAHAAALFDFWFEDEVQLIAPTLLDYEVVSTLRRLVHREYLTQDEGQEALQHFQRINIHLDNNQELLSQAWDLAQKFHQPTVYDTTYLALALAEDCQLWTADKRFYNAVRSKVKNIYCLGISDGSITIDETVYGDGWDLPEAENQ